MAAIPRGVALAAGAAGAGGAIAFVGVQLLHKEPAPKPCPSERCRRDAFEGLARKWDSMVRFDEFITGIGRWRRRMARRAEGDVLEVAIGTGRNLSYYDAAKVHSITGVDFSRTMLEQCDAKRADAGTIPLKLKVASSKKMAFEDDSFDTVVDTFGICSFEEPVEALREMRRVVRENGQVLLLEHGCSSWEFVQGMLNKGAQRHAEKFGCYPNRDIASLVREAGLYIETDERKHFGTTYLLVCKKRSPHESE